MDGTEADINVFTFRCTKSVTNEEKQYGEFYIAIRRLYMEI